MYYFAYGSNMCTGRLRCRVPSAKPLFVSPLYGYRLRFHKRSSDRSGKADAEFTGNQADVVWGVVFEIDGHEKSNLDQAEGLGRGYDEKEINLKDCNNQNYMGLSPWLRQVVKTLFAVRCFSIVLPLLPVSR